MFNSGSRRSTSSLPARANPRRVPITRSLLEWDSCPLWSRNLWAPGTASCRIRHAGDWGAAVQVPRESHRSHLPKIGGVRQNQPERGQGWRIVPELPVGWQEWERSFPTHPGLCPQQHGVIFKKGGEELECPEALGKAQRGEAPAFPNSPAGTKGEKRKAQGTAGATSSEGWPRDTKAPAAAAGSLISISRNGAENQTPSARNPSPDLKI